jgi:hypothetical protein
MKKDIIIAVFVGFVTGALVAIVAVNLPSFIKNSTQKIAKALPKQENTPTASPTPTVDLKTISIDSPKDGDIQKESKIKLSGKGLANSTIFLDTENDSQIAQSSEDGSYKFDITLLEGSNDIAITSYTQTEEVSKIIRSYYTPEKL